MCYEMELTACAADGRSTQSFSIEDESASEASSRRVRGSSWGGLMVSGPRVSIDSIDILGVDGGGFEKRRGLLRTAREMTRGGWVAARKRRVCHVPTSCHSTPSGPFFRPTITRFACHLTRARFGLSLAKADTYIVL